jgi:hypothetical protein
MAADRSGICASRPRACRGMGAAFLLAVSLSTLGLSMRPAAAQTTSFTCDKSTGATQSCTSSSLSGETAVVSPNPNNFSGATLAVTIVVSGPVSGTATGTITDNNTS